MTIKEARVFANLTQQATADLLGVPVRTIGDWETGYSQPPKYVEKLIVEKLQQLTTKKTSKPRNMRVIEIPSFRAVSSGVNTLDGLFGEQSRFSKWVDSHQSLLWRHIFEPSDFLWHENRNIDTSVWALAINEGVTAEDTYPYEIITFPGGIFLVATADEKNPDDLNETVDCMMAWIQSSEVFEYGDFPQSGMCNMPNPDGKVDSLLGISQQQIFLPLKSREK